MGLAELQGALARLYIDRQMRDRFFTDPADVGAELGLDADEALSLSRTPRRQVEQFADSLRRKRRDQVRRVVPIAARALGSRYAELFEQYAGESAPRGSKADLDDACGFVDTLRRRIDQVEPPWAVNLARYELAWRLASRPGRTPIVRMFRYPVARLATGRDPDAVTPRMTIAFWWRVSRRSPVRHIAMGIPAWR